MLRREIRKLKDALAASEANRQSMFDRLRHADLRLSQSSPTIKSLQHSVNTLEEKLRDAVHRSEELYRARDEAYLKMEKSAGTWAEALRTAEAERDAATHRAAVAEKRAEKLDAQSQRNHRALLTLAGVIENISTPSLMVEEGALPGENNRA